MKITGEKIFTTPTHSFAIGPCESEYTLNYSVDGKTWTAYDSSTPSGQTAIVNFAVPNLMYKLSGATGDILIQY